MSSIAASSGLQRTAAFYESVIGKKAVMAVTGLILCGFVLVHMIGNLQLFQGPEKLNHYAELLRISMPLLWTARIVLLLCVFLHILSAYQLWMLKRAARPVDYVRKSSIATTYAARTMLVSGPILLAFIVYHILHFTTGQAHPSFEPGNVYANVVAGFQNPLASIFYMVANILLATHLYHGVWSMFQTMGVNHPKYTPKLRLLAKLYGIVIGAGNVSMPLAVLAGFVK
ncbi:MAG: succinate dehydrogenase cytochrome b subunit [Bryobacter sp.]|nr:succinate dehydrogenase cytochrome b subunit [Bryobacter sp.]